MEGKQCPSKRISIHHNSVDLFEFDEQNPRVQTECGDNAAAGKVECVESNKEDVEIDLAENQYRKGRWPTGDAGPIMMIPL